MTTTIRPARVSENVPRSIPSVRGREPAPPPRSPRGTRDPRVPFAAILTAYVVMGVGWLGFNRSVSQIATIVVAGCALDMALHWLLRKRELLMPLSAYISALSLAILLNYAHDPWLLLLPVFLTIGSKYVFTVDGKHHFNPSLFGVATTLLFAGDLLTAAPAYQWGGSWAMSAFIVSAALALFVFRIGRGWLIVSFLVAYALQTALRAWIMRAHLPAEMLFLGTMTTPPFYLFTFFMLTDPKTSPSSARAQVMLGVSIALVDLYLHTKQSVFTFFYAAFAVATIRFVWMHATAMWRDGLGVHLRTRLLARRMLATFGVLGAVSLTAGFTYRQLIHPRVALTDAGFTLEEIAPAASGLSIRIDPASLDLVDPRLRHIAKWILSVGASVSAADVDGDGRVDLFVTSPLAVPEDRVALFRNAGRFRFERVPVPALDRLRGHPADVGLPGGALFLDYDNDGDSDLFVNVSFGRAMLLRNDLTETGRLGFTDVSAAAGVDAYGISVAANAIDFDRDGRLDIVIGNTLEINLPGYRHPTPLNIFALPRPEYEGDRRMFAFMHDGWHNATNGGPIVLFRNRGDGSFESLDAAALGMSQTHWTISIGTGDLNRDGWTDLYVANDFGRDDLYLNEEGKRWRRVAGRLFGDIGMDTYKGMNSSIADFDRNGWLDVYVSNVHHPLQAEGSLLWMNRGAQPDGAPRLRDEASGRGALNEDRFGWGAAVGDLANRGWQDIVQTNGMVDDRLDDRHDGCPDYWYVNHKLMQSTSEIHTFADMWGDIRGRCIYPNEARRVYYNRGADARPQFVDVAALVGLTKRDNSRGVALADLNDDGRLDLVIANQHAAPSLHRNAPTASGVGSSWIGLTLVGDGQRCSRQALGSTVEVVGDRPQIREAQGANGFAAQNEGRVHFGLGSRPSNLAVPIRVRWCGGDVTELRLQPNRYHRIAQ